MLLSEAVEGYMMDSRINQSKANIRIKEQQLSYFFKWAKEKGATEIHTVTVNTVRAFIVHLQSLKANELNPRKPTLDRPLSPLTVKGYLRVIKAFFNWCKREGYLEGRDNPTDRVPRIKIPHYVISTFTPEQMAAMLDSCDVDTATGFRDYSLLLVLMDTGIRLSELCGLTLDHIHDGYLTVFGKGEKEREVGMGPTAARALWKYVHLHRKPRLATEKRVFLAKGGAPLTANGVTQLISRIGERVGIEGVRVSAHTFRHSFAKSWLQHGGEIYKLSLILGHSDIQTTQEYLKDFHSRDARVEHSQYSPVESNNLGKTRKEGKKKL